MVGSDREVSEPHPRLVHQAQSNATKIEDRASVDEGIVLHVEDPLAVDRRSNACPFLQEKETMPQSSRSRGPRFRLLGPGEIFAKSVTFCDIL
jgi:hypothetical protein